MLRTLFDIGNDWAVLDAAIEDRGGEILPEDEAVFDAWADSLQQEEGVKLDRYCNYVAQLEMEKDACERQAEEYEERAEKRAKRIAWLHKMMQDYLARTGRKKVQTETGRVVSVQGHGGKIPVVIDAEAKPMESGDPRFVREKFEWDKDAIRDALEAGESLSFAKLGERGSSLRIR